MELVRLGRGVSVVPDHCARSLLEKGTLRVIRPRNRKRATNKIYAITRAGAYRSQETERLLGMLVS